MSEEQSEHHDSATWHTLYKASMEENDFLAEFYYDHVPLWLYSRVHKVTGWRAKIVVTPVYIDGERTGTRYRFKWVKS